MGQREWSSSHPETAEVDETRTIIKVGDTVKLCYLDDNRIEEYSIINEDREPILGEIRHTSPLAKKMIGLEEEDEDSLLVGQKLTKFKILEIKSTDAANEKSSNPESIPIQRDDNPIAIQLPEKFQRKIKPDYFYDEDYKFFLRDLALFLIDNLGPITEDHLCMKIARLHGFSKTGRKIKETILSSINRYRAPKNAANGDRIFWPDNMNPSTFIAFRGIHKEERTWDLVPYPERLGLACSIISQVSRRSPFERLVREIGLSRVTTDRRVELEKLLTEAAQINN